MGDDASNRIKERIEALYEKSFAYLDSIKSQAGDEEAVRAHLKSFVLHRFFLVDEDPASDDIATLATMSTEKLLRIDRKNALGDMPNNCAGTSSETLKKALLIMTLHKQLGVRFDPLENDTIAQLSRSIVQQLGGDHG
ncbi:hypothetical protein [Raoultibacter phocaeensis]|uniref:hypothetical protein n=1 Tax=Raoultibacter phocaeensis TaxID=2479841 RepID=UPI00111A1D76|nr:hypothetical protein [Raoultibacter phocaeensis]